MQKTKGASHHFNNVFFKPTNVMVSPDSAMMKHIGMLNIYRVLVEFKPHSFWVNAKVK